MSHFDELLALLELERRDGLLEHRARMERLTLAQRVADGVALDDLEPVEEAWGLGGRLLVDYERPRGAAIADGFRPGAVVELAAGQASERAVVAKKRGSRLQLVFERPPHEALLSGRVVAELAPDDLTIDRAADAVRSLSRAERGRERRCRDLVLGETSPRFGRPPEVALPPRLNREQAEAVRRALSAQDLFLVHGPPGTGKSTVLVEVIAQAVRRGERVLAAAASNAAVDNLLDLCLRAGLAAVRIGHPARVAEALVGHTLDLLVEAHPEQEIARQLFDEAYRLRGFARRQRLQGRSRQRFASAREAEQQARALIDEARQHEKRAITSILGGAQVICATCTTVGSQRDLGDFDLAVIDEATQALEPLAYWPLLSAPRLVLAGDHRQLPPTVLSEEASERGLSVSLFERLLALHGDAVKLTLREQHRMHPVLMHFPSLEMYGGELLAHPSVEGRLLEAPGVAAPPLLFIDTAGRGFSEVREQESDSYANVGEAALIEARVRELLAAGCAPRELGVIAPYSAQVAKLRERLADTEVEIATVDGFQGREKEAVLLSLVRSNDAGEIGFLADLRRMNVAITRARRHLFVVGDAGTLAALPYYERFIDHARASGGYVSVWEWPAAAEL